MEEAKVTKACKTKKVWIVLFACLATRNVNMELLQDRSTESFLMSFQRHCSENSVPTYILTDCASEYKRADLEIKRMLETDEMQSYLAEKGVKWQFTPANSAQHNSVTESLVKQAKLALYGVFKSSNLTETEFNTAVKIAQGKLNQRPLIAISDDPNDQNILSITPAHLKLGKALISLPSSFDTVQDLNKISVGSRWEQRKRLQRKFFLRFQDEYLMSLRKLNTKQLDNKALEEGDVVLLLDEKRSKEEYPIARVTKVFTGSDGIVRSAELRLPTKMKETKKNKRQRGANVNKLLCYENKAKFIHRGVEKLAFLEGNSSVSNKSNNCNDVQDQNIDMDVNPTSSFDDGGSKH